MKENNIIMKYNEENNNEYNENIWRKRIWKCEEMIMKNEEN